MYLPPLCSRWDLGRRAVKARVVRGSVAKNPLNRVRIQLQVTTYNTTKSVFRIYNVVYNIMLMVDAIANQQVYEQSTVPTGTDLKAHYLQTCSQALEAWRSVTMRLIMNEKGLSFASCSLVRMHPPRLRG